MNRCKRAIATWVVCATAVVSACQKSQAVGEREHEHAEGADDHGHEDELSHAGEENVVRVEQSMLRDLRVTTQKAQSRPAGDVVTVLGELRVDEDRYAEVGTSIGARVARVLVAPGDQVVAGQALVELDSPEVGKARAEQLTARARLDLAKQTVERKEPLAAEQIVPQRELQIALSELAQAEAEHRASQQVLAALSATSGAGARVVLTSPIAGTVIERNALRGRLVDAARPLFTIGNLSQLWLVVHAFERDALRMRTPATAQVAFPALPGHNASGVVTRVASLVDPASRTVDVRLVVDNPSGVLRPGMSASALVPLGSETEAVVTVPVAALQRQPQGWCVFIPGPHEGEFEVRDVGRGRDLNGEVEVLSGLRAGEQVVVDGAFLLKSEADKARGGEPEHHH